MKIAKADQAQGYLVWISDLLLPVILYGISLSFPSISSETDYFMPQLVVRARDFEQRIAVRDESGIFTYRQLLADSEQLAFRLIEGSKDLAEQRVAFLVDPSYDYVVTQWAIWQAGGIAVPLCTAHPLASIRYVLEDAEVSIVIAKGKHCSFLSDLCRESSLPLINLQQEKENRSLVKRLPIIESGRRAMILYTSGTTGQPKGVVSTHANIEAQIATLVEAWSWQKEDHILNILPLHHVHGIINVLSCALWSGACCEFLRRFDPDVVWRTFAMGFVNVFMAVPTVYYKLIAHWQNENAEERNRFSQALRHFRLMVSGSAALPVSVLEDWREISGHTLLERYGMTEIGMALSNPYDGERRPGHVGLPLPGVQVRIVDEHDVVVPAGESGEIQVKGPGVFSEYWKRHQATMAAFTQDGWFKTGDIAKISQGYHQIMGRNSVDIIKSGGYKISALQIEEVMRGHQDVSDVAVVGLPDEEWGEIIGAAIVPSQENLDKEGLIRWLKDYLPGYQLPRRFLLIEDLPRNTLGKVTKKAVLQLFVGN